MTDVAVPFTGWGRDAWSAQGFGEGSVTTTALSGFVGNVTTETVSNVSVPLVGVEAAAHFGGIMVEPDLRVFPGGLQATVPSPTVTTDISVAVDAISTGLVSGFSATDVIIDVEFGVNGEQALAQISGVTVAPDTNIFPIGLQALGVVGSGTTIIGDSNLTLSGLEASAIGSGVDTTISVRPLLVGQQADATTSGVLVWGVIVPNQTSGFEPVSPNGQSNWVEITPEVA